MSETDKNYRTIKQIIKDSTDRELERYETKNLTPDELKRMAAAAQRKKKQHYRKLAGVAALLAVVLFGAIMAFNNFSTDVEADKNAKEEIVTEDGVVIEDGGWGSSSEDNWTVTDWNEIKAVKATVPELVIPKYVPKGYNFTNLKIQGSENALDIEYTYLCSDEKVFILHQCIYNEGLDAINIYNIDRSIESKKGKIYIMERMENNKAIMQLDDGIIVELWSNFSDSDIIKIVENMDY